MLANDTDVDSVLFSLDSVDTVAGAGSVSIVNDQLVFNPGTDFDYLPEGVEQQVVVNYTMSDDAGEPSSSQVTITVTGTNDGSVIVNDTNSITELSNDTTTSNLVTGDITNSSDYDLDIGSTFTVTTVNGNDLTENTITAEPADANGIIVTTVKGEVVSEGDELSSIDHWNFTHSGGALTIDTLTESGDNFIDINGDGIKHHLDVMIILYDSNGNQIAINDDSSQGTDDGSTNENGIGHIQDSYLNIDDLPAGEYTLSVGSWLLTNEEVANDSNEFARTNFLDPETGPYQIIFTGQTEVSTVQQAATIQGEYGTLTVNPDGTYSYELDDNNADVQALSESETMIESFDLTVQVDNEAGNTSDHYNNALDITITGTNDSPVATADSNLSTDENHSITIDVLNNDTDPENDALTITHIQDQEVIDNGPAVVIYGDDPNIILGSAQLVNGEIQFNPTGTLQLLDNGESQEITFEYTISDGELPDSASITINVDGIDDIPPTAVDDTTLTSGGLFGQYWGYVDDASSPNLTNIEQIINYIDATENELTFISTSIDYSRVTVGSDGNYDLAEDVDAYGVPQHLVNFLGTDASTLETVNGGSTVDATDGILKLTGNLNVNSAGTYTFDVHHDDGFQIKIDGQDVFEFDGLTAPTTSTETVELTEGLHSVEVYYWDQGGEYVFEVELNDVSGINIWGSENLSYPEEGILATYEGTPITIDVLANDFDLDGSVDATSVVIQQQPEHGSIELNSNGTVTYTPELSYSGTDNFSYTVADNEGNVSNVADVFVNVLYVDEISGRAGVDTFQLDTAGQLAISLGAYHDADNNGAPVGPEATQVKQVSLTEDITIASGDSNDYIDLGASHADNTVFTGSSLAYQAPDNSLSQNELANTLFMQQENITDNSGIIPQTILSEVQPYSDTVNMGSGNDTVIGGGGSLVAHGGAGDDLLIGNDGSDAFRGGANNDTLQGKGGNDVLRGDAGNDSLDGGAGSDLLIGGTGDDLLIGGSEADTFIWLEGDTGTDHIQDFNMSEGDKLDLTDILQLSDGNKLDDFLDFYGDGTNTTIEIHAEGVNSDVTQTIILDGVDLGADTTGSEDVTIINDLFSNGSLIISDVTAVDSDTSVTIPEDDPTS